MKKLIWIICLSTFMVQAQEYRQENDAKIEFKIKNMGFNVSGAFDEHKTKVVFDAAALSKSKIETVILVNSVNTKNKKRDKHLINEDYFETSRFDKILLKSSNLVKLKSGNFQMTANLTIKKITKRIIIPLKISESGRSITIDSTFKINRLDYGVGESSWVMGDIVTIKVHFKGKN